MMLKCTTLGAFDRQGHFMLRLCSGASPWPGQGAKGHEGGEWWLLFSNDTCGAGPSILCLGQATAEHEGGRDAFRDE